MEFRVLGTRDMTYICIWKRKLDIEWQLTYLRFSTRYDGFEGICGFPNLWSDFRYPKFQRPYYAEDPNRDQYLDDPSFAGCDYSLNPSAAIICLFNHDISEVLKKLLAAGDASLVADASSVSIWMDAVLRR